MVFPANSLALEGHDPPASARGGSVVRAVNRDPTDEKGDDRTVTV